jgi:NAD-dependent SIR2 family protein deacetylase
VAWRCRVPAFKRLSSAKCKNSRRKWFACADRKRQSECQCVACGATVQRTALWHGAAASRRSSVFQVLSAKTLDENGLLVRTGSVRASVSVPHAAQPCSALRCGKALPHPRRPSVSQVLKAPPQRACFCLSKRQSECQCAACGATVQRTALWHGAAASTESKRLSSAESSSSKKMFLLVEASERVSVCRMRRNRAAHCAVAWRWRVPAFKRLSSAKCKNSRRKWFACACADRKRQSECQCVACGATVQRTALWHGAAASRRSSVFQVLSAKTLEENGLLVRTGSVRASVSVSHAAQPCSALRCGMALPRPGVQASFKC